MTTMATAGLPTTVPTALGMTADHIETHGLMCGEWQSVSKPKKGCAIGTLRMVCGLPAQWDGLDSTDKLFVGALNTLIAYLGFEYCASDAYDGVSALLSWSDSHANGDNGIDPTPEAVVEAFRKAARLARENPEQHQP